MEHEVPSTNSETTDEALVIETLRDPGTYDALVTRHQGALERFILHRFTRDRFQAEDVIQETFMKAYVSLGTFDPSRKFKTWLYAIAANTAKSLLRRPAVEDIADYANVIKAHDSPEQYVEALLEHGALQATLDQLDPHHRLVLEMHYTQGMPYSEICVALGLKLSTVKTRMFRARQQLRCQAVERLSSEYVDNRF